MYSRPQDYSYNPYQSPTYNSYQGTGYGYSSFNDQVSLPQILPLTSNLPAYTYNFHDLQQQNFEETRKPVYAQYSRVEEEPIIRNKSFIEGFDNNNYALMNKQKSYARNIKGRLLNNQNPNSEMANQQKIKSYKQELQAQIEEVRARKLAQKQKIQKQQAERERKFYEEFKIKAQIKSDKEDKKQENHYFMMRTIHKFKKNRNQEEQKDKDPIKINKNNIQSPSPPIKGRGMTYLNKSSLDNWAQVRVKSPIDNSNQTIKNIQTQERHERGGRYERRFSKMEQQIMKQRMNEQQRLSKLLLFQQRVLQKISTIKSEIRNTAIDLDGDKQVQRIRNNLKARPIPYDQQLFKSDIKNKSNFDANLYYSLPMREPKLNRSRYSVKLRDSSNKSKQKVKSELSQFLENDKNIKINLNQEQHISGQILT